jgi:naphthalene 1,2-dioxygenase ferredoxin reductase component
VVKLTGTVARLDRVAPDVVVVSIALPEGKPLDFVPGQFAKVRFGRLPARSYSFANQPGEAQVEFHVRVVPNGVVSQFVGQQLKVGAAVDIRAPFGEACWSGVTPRRLILLGGGTGLAPMSSILGAALRAGQSPESIHLYHGVRSTRDLYAVSAIQQLSDEHGFRFVSAVADKPAAGMAQGHLHEVLAQDFPDLSAAEIFAAGPPPMVEAVRKLAIERGARPESIRADPFHAAEPQRKSLWERVTGFAGL